MNPNRNDADARSGVVTFGETMALITSGNYGPLQHTKSLSLGIGGAESNVAIALSRLGEVATWIGKVGCDPFGDLVLREIQAEGVHVIGLRDPGSPTGLMFKERRTATETRVWYYRVDSAGSHLGVADIAPNVIRTSAILHVTGISPALSAQMFALTEYAIGVAEEAGTIVSLDLNYRSKLWSPENARDAYRRLIPHADIVFGGNDEAAIALGREDSPLGLAHGLVGMGASQAVVKLGPLGAVAVVDGEEHQHVAMPIEPIDTVGAGDAFVAGYLSEFLRGAPAPVRLSAGIMVASHVCLVPGDWEGLPRRDELEELASFVLVKR